MFQAEGTRSSGAGMPGSVSNTREAGEARVRVRGRGELGAPRHWKGFDFYSVLRNTGGVAWLEKERDDGGTFFPPSVTVPTKPLLIVSAQK